MFSILIVFFGMEPGGVLKETFEDMNSCDDIFMYLFLIF